MTRDTDVTSDNRRPRRAGWYIAGLVGAAVAAYFGCYLCLGESHPDETGHFKRPTTIRDYRISRPLIFVPAAWLESNLTGRTVVVAEKQDGPFTSTDGKYTMTVHSFTLFRWSVDPGLGFGHGFPARTIE